MLELGPLDSAYRSVRSVSMDDARAAGGTVTLAKHQMFKHMPPHPLSLLDDEG